jgi:uncharacterized membrane protein YfcA
LFGVLTPDPAPELTAALRLPLVVLASAVAGAVNSIAGGGTLLTFPALVGLGIPPIVANATSTVALWPGALGSMWGYRRELEGMQRWAAVFAMPSLAGGLVGAALLLRTPPERFAELVPWLVLGATALFMAQGAITRRAAGGRREAGRSALGFGLSALGGAPQSRAARAESREPRAAPLPPSVLLYQFLVAIYGGYFGAGVGILMLAALGFAGFTNIHQMNGLKNWGGLCMNAVAAITFAFTDIVSWPVALAMATGATAGGYAGSRMAQRVPQLAVRRAIVVIGITSGVWLLVS